MDEGEGWSGWDCLFFREQRAHLEAAIMCNHSFPSREAFLLNDVSPSFFLPFVHPLLPSGTSLVLLSVPKLAEEGPSLPSLTMQREAKCAVFRGLIQSITHLSPSSIFSSHARKTAVPKTPPTTPQSKNSCRHQGKDGFPNHISCMATSMGGHLPSGCGAKSTNSGCLPYREEQAT